MVGWRAIPDGLDAGVAREPFWRDVDAKFVVLFFRDDARVAPRREHLLRGAETCGRGGGGGREGERYS